MPPKAAKGGHGWKRNSRHGSDDGKTVSTYWDDEDSESKTKTKSHEQWQNDHWKQKPSSSWLGGWNAASSWHGQHGGQKQSSSWLGGQKHSSEGAQPSTSASTTFRSWANWRSKHDINDDSGGSGKSDGARTGSHEARGGMRPVEAVDHRRSDDETMRFLDLVKVLGWRQNSRSPLRQRPTIHSSDEDERRGRSRSRHTTRRERSQSRQEDPAARQRPVLRASAQSMDSLESSRYEPRDSASRKDSHQVDATTAATGTPKSAKSGPKAAKPKPPHGPPPARVRARCPSPPRNSAKIGIAAAVTQSKFEDNKELAEAAEQPLLPRPKLQMKGSVAQESSKFKPKFASAAATRSVPKKHMGLGLSRVLTLEKAAKDNSDNTTGKPADPNSQVSTADPSSRPGTPPRVKRSYQERQEMQQEDEEARRRVEDKEADYGEAKSAATNGESAAGEDEDEQQEQQARPVLPLPRRKCGLSLKSSMSGMVASANSRSGKSGEGDFEAAGAAKPRAASCLQQKEQQNQEPHQEQQEQQNHAAAAAAAAAVKDGERIRAQWGDFPWHVLKDPETTKSKLARLGPGEFYDADVCRTQSIIGADAADTESEESMDYWHGTTCENASNILRTGFNDLPCPCGRKSQVPPYDLLHGVFGSITSVMATRYATRREEDGLRKRSLFDHGIIIHAKVPCHSGRRWTNGKTCDRKQLCYAASSIRVCSVRFLRARVPEPVEVS